MGFEIGQKLRVKDLGGIGKPPFAVGDVVTYSGPGIGGAVRVKEFPSYDFFPYRFEAVPETKPFEPKVRKGDKLIVTNDIDTESVKNGDGCEAAGDSFLTSKGNEVVRLVGQPSYKQYLVARFKRAPATAPFVPKFKKGQKLSVLSGSEGVYFEKGQVVTASEDSRIAERGFLEGVEVVGLIEEPNHPRGFRVDRFEAVPFAPKFKKGERLLVNDANGMNSLAPGTFVIADADSFLDEKGIENVAVHGEINGRSYTGLYVGRFEKAAPTAFNWLYGPTVKSFAAAPVTASVFTVPAPAPAPKFKDGQRLRVTDAGMSSSVLKKGQIVRAKGDSFVESPFFGLEVVRIDAAGGTFNASRFEAAPGVFLEEAPAVNSVPGLVYFVSDGTDSFLTDDLKDISDGDKVSVFEFKRAGQAKTSVI